MNQAGTSEVNFRPSEPPEGSGPVRYKHVTPNGVSRSRKLSFLCPFVDTCSNAKFGRVESSRPFAM